MKRRTKRKVFPVTKNSLDTIELEGPFETFLHQEEIIRKYMIGNRKLKFVGSTNRFHTNNKTYEGRITMTYDRYFEVHASQDEGPEWSFKSFENERQLLEEWEILK